MKSTEDFARVQDEAVRLIKERIVFRSQAARHLDVHENVLCKSDAGNSLHIHDRPSVVMVPEQRESERLRREAAEIG
jgi:transposase-like protein